MTHVPDPDGRLTPSPERLNEIAEVYRAMGLNPNGQFPVFGQQPLMKLTVRPLLSNNTSFE